MISTAINRTIGIERTRRGTEEHERNETNGWNRTGGIERQNSWHSGRKKEVGGTGGQKKGNWERDGVGRKGRHRGPVFPPRQNLSFLNEERKEREGEKKGKGKWEGTDGTGRDKDFKF